MIEVYDVDFAYYTPKRYRELITHPFGRGHGRSVLEGVKIHLETGMSAALVGVNGAGKTTLLKLVGGMIYPTRGRVLVHGLDTMVDWRGLRKRVGYVINEDRSFHWRLTGRENLVFFAALGNLYGRAAAMRIDELLVFVGLGAAGDKRVGEYSSGMRQRLAIARGLLNDPDVLLLDEPTKSLDPAGGRMIRKALAEWASRSGRTRALIVATNDAEDVSAMCSVFYMISSGRVTFGGPVVDGTAEGIHRIGTVAGLDGVNLRQDHA
jgi:ABC-2 type transport system ATP-binding protein